VVTNNYNYNNYNDDYNFYPIEFVESHNIRSVRDVERFDQHAQALITKCTNEVFDLGNRSTPFMYGERARCLRASGYSANDTAYLQAKFPIRGSY